MSSACLETLRISVPDSDTWNFFLLFFSSFSASISCSFFLVFSHNRKFLVLWSHRCWFQWLTSWLHCFPHCFPTASSPKSLSAYTWYVTLPSELWGSLVPLSVSENEPLGMNPLECIFFPCVNDSLQAMKKRVSMIWCERRYVQGFWLEDLC